MMDFVTDATVCLRCFLLIVHYFLSISCQMYNTDITLDNTNILMCYHYKYYRSYHEDEKQKPMLSFPCSPGKYCISTRNIGDPEFAMGLCSSGFDGEPNSNFGIDDNECDKIGIDKCAKRIVETDRETVVCCCKSNNCNDQQKAIKFLESFQPYCYKYNGISTAMATKEQIENYVCLLEYGSCMTLIYEENGIEMASGICERFITHALITCSMIGEDKCLDSKGINNMAKKRHMPTGVKGICCCSGNKCNGFNKVNATIDVIKSVSTTLTTQFVTIVIGVFVTLAVTRNFI